MPKAMRITEATPTAADEWDHVWLNCDHATYFQSREWAELWRAYTGSRVSPAAISVTFTDGKRAIVPFSRVRGRLGLTSRFVMSPAGTFGGPISEDRLESQHTQLIADYVFGVPRVQWRINPYDPNAASLHRVGYAPDVTHVLDLSDGFEACVRRWSQSHRRSARQAARAGVTVQEASTREDWDAFYGAYESSLERWGESATSRYEKRLFDLLADSRSRHVRLWVARHENRLAAGGLFLYSRRHVVYWLGAAHAAFFKVRPVHLLMHRAIEDAVDRGYAWFDFDPSGGHEGVRAFKERFGTVALEAGLVTRARRLPMLRRSPPSPVV
jgi:CelD/BcsL family acetyltransferase involved in cellulose biosynthesis